MLRRKIRPQQPRQNPDPIALLPRPSRLTHRHSPHHLPPLHHLHPHANQFLLFITLTRRVFLCRQTAVQLRHSVETILPIISSLRFSSVQLRQPRQNQLSDLLQLLRLALDLARKLSASSRFNVYRTIQLSRKMEKVEGDISRWIQRLLPVHVMDDVMSMRAESNARFDRLERKMEGAGDGKIGFLEIVEREGEVVVGSRVRVGKERVKDMLMLELGGGGGELVGICGIGGSGKTTLAREICKDAKIRSMRRFFIGFSMAM